MSDKNYSIKHNSDQTKRIKILRLVWGEAENFANRLNEKLHAIARTVKVLPVGMRSNLDGECGRARVFLHPVCSLGVAE